MVTKTITLDVWKPLRESITVVQREAGARTLNFQIMSNGAALDLTAKTVTFYATKPDDSIVFNACTTTSATAGKCSYLVTAQTVAVAGTLTACLIITGVDYELRTQDFAITIDASPDYTSAVESLDEFTALAALSGDIADSTSRLDDIEAVTGIVKGDGSGTYAAATAADIHALTEAAGGWIAAGETWTYASASTFTVSGNVTTKYQKGDKLKLTQTTPKYFYITAISYGAPNTTITVTAGTDYTIANAAITLPFYSRVANPYGFPDWFNFTPTPGATGSMTYGSVTYSHCKFRVSGKTCTYSVGYANGTTGGTASTGITFTLPIAAIASYNTGCGWTYDGAEALGLCGTGSSTTVVTVQKADMTNWALAGTKLVSLQLSYEI